VILSLKINGALKEFGINKNSNFQVLRSGSQIPLTGKKETRKNTGIEQGTKGKNMLTAVLQ